MNFDQRPSDMTGLRFADRWFDRLTQATGSPSSGNLRCIR